MSNGRLDYLQYLPVYQDGCVGVIDQNYQGDSAMQISILIWLNYVAKIFQNQDVAVAKARVADA
jgi:hypothetical protein